MKRIAALLLLAPLLLAQAPTFLKDTRLPPAFTAAFSMYQLCEVKPPATAPDNMLYYLEATNGTTTTLYMKSFFNQSPLLPGAPPRFKDNKVWWFVVRDPAHQNLYTARVYSETLHEVALAAINLGPPRRDLVARYYKHFTVPPDPAPPTPVPVGNPSNGAPVQWFHTSGRNGSPPANDPGYFAMLATPVVGPDNKHYKPPYAIVGGGAGVLHQAYGELVYQNVNLSPGLTPASFTPPTGYKPAGTDRPNLIGVVMSKVNCSVCHYVDEGHPTLLLAPEIQTPNWKPKCAP